MRSLVVVSTVLVAAVAFAQPVPPPPVPQLPDEPLPEWHPPPPSNARALFLQVSPEVRRRLWN